MKSAALSIEREGRMVTLAREILAEAARLAPDGADADQLALAVQAVMAPLRDRSVPPSSLVIGLAKAGASVMALAELPDPEAAFVAADRALRAYFVGASELVEASQRAGSLRPARVN